MLVRKIKRLAIANRGEIASRIIKTAHAMGIETVLLHSPVDRHTRAWRQACFKVELPGNPLGESYLNAEALITLAQQAGADAIHPGFGFLSENPSFAQKVLASGLIWVGPSPEAMNALSNKSEAKKRAQRLGIPVLPAIHETDFPDSETFLKAVLNQMGCPFVFKAAAGGGGRGMKVVTDPTQAPEAMTRAKAEALAAFGNDHLLAERFLTNPRHVEVQAFGAPDGYVYILSDRDCTIQRRYQKVIEEGPSHLPMALKEQMYEAARILLKDAGYQNAGTVEFLVQDQQFYFMEVNTRLQVEHPVTEMILKVDLVKAQLECAQKLELSQKGLFERPPIGHAIECRIYAENPYEDGLPSTGWIGRIDWPCFPNVRVDSGIDPGDWVTSHYDPMIAKIIAWGTSRSEAIALMDQALAQSRVFGVYTNIPSLRKVLNHPDFLNNCHNINFWHSHKLGENSLPLEPRISSIYVQSPQQLLNSGLDLWLKDGQALDPQNAMAFLGEVWIYQDGHIRLGWSERKIQPMSKDSQSWQLDESVLKAPIPGRIIKVFVQQGDIVQPGQTLLILEAMKMEYALKAPIQAQVTQVCVQEGDLASPQQPLIYWNKIS